jgi:hypothetical protein
LSLTLLLVGIRLFGLLLMMQYDNVALCTVAARKSASESRTEKIAAFSLPVTAVTYFDSLKQDNLGREYT